MPRDEMIPAEMEALLSHRDVVRVAFRDDDEIYLIPLGYIWRRSALYGVTEPGRKTRLASASPRVAFQVDTAAQTGLFEWQSVTGSGCFEIIDDAAEKRAVLGGLLSLAAGAPARWRKEQVTRLASGELVVWCIRPDRMTGVRYAPTIAESP